MLSAATTADAAQRVPRAAQRRGVSDGTRALRRRRDAHTVVTAATHARDSEQHGHVLKSRQLQVVAERHTIQWEGLRQQSPAIKTTFWGLLQPVGPLGRRWRCFGGWACTLECPRCVASGPTTENMPPKTFFKNSTRKNFRVTRWWASGSTRSRAPEREPQCDVPRSQRICWYFADAKEFCTRMLLVANFRCFINGEGRTDPLVTSKLLPIKPW